MTGARGKSQLQIGGRPRGGAHVEHVGGRKGLRRKQGVGMGPTGGSGARHGEERTENIRTMSVTLDVSKLSG